jgi:small-conductance mechanosensitive channel
VINSIKRLIVILIILLVLAAGTLLAYDAFISNPINLPNVLDESVKIAVIVGFWLVVLFFISRAKPAIAKYFGDQPAMIVQLFLGSIAVLVMIFAILRVFGASFQSLLEGAGIITITIGLIISTFVGSFLNGALVYATHRFKVGDDVMINNIPARITEVSTLATRVRTDVGHIAIPNSAIASGGVIITRLHPHERELVGRLPYAEGDRVVTTYMQGEGIVKEVTPVNTRVLLDSGRELFFLNNSVLTGSVAVAKISGQRLSEHAKPKTENKPA